MSLYRVFTRSATSFETFARARKRTVRSGLTYAEAQQYCRRENENRTPAQVKRGFKHEFEVQ